MSSRREGPRSSGSALRTADSERSAFWGQLTRSYGRRLLAYARRTRCSEDEATDIVAEVWSVALTKEETLKGEDDRWPVLRTIARAVCADRVRVWRREAPLCLSDTLVPLADSAATNVDESALHYWWLVVRDELSGQQRTAVDFRFRWGWSYEHVSWALGCTESTARVHVKRGIAKLRDIVRGLPPPRSQDD